MAPSSVQMPASSNAAGPGETATMGARPRLAMIVTEFPKTTETFIMRDAVEFNRRGYDVRIYHLTPFNKREVVHDFAAVTLQWARGFPYLSAGVIGATLRAMLRRPSVWLGVIKDI